MLLVFGSALDDHPAALVRRWRDRGRDAALVTPRDLSTPGWRLRVAGGADLGAAVSGRRVERADVEAVVCALPCIAPYELVHVVEADREYVAQEMGAFLLAWLTAFDGPVLDRASPVNLAGCGRSTWQWAALAHRTGVAADPAWIGPTTSVTVVGGEPIGEHSDGLLDAARTMARAGERTLVTFTFAAGDAVLVGAESRPRLGEPEVADALLTVLEAA